MNLPARIPRATYRLQLHPGFGFDDLARIIPYLHDLGISDVYLSPIFRAYPGSTHGYDVCDPNEVNPEIGGRDGLMKVSELLRQREMGLLVDFVPNHMGIAGSLNWRWTDVLENGRLSKWAGFFDIQWNPRQTALQDRIIVPMLGDFYGRVLEKGDIKVAYDESRFWACYGTLRFPLCPQSYSLILHHLAWHKNPGNAIAQQVEALASQFRDLDRDWAAKEPATTEDRNRERDSLRVEFGALIREKNLAGELDEVLVKLNGTPGQPESFDVLHEILEAQNYRLAFWKTGTHEINYRRFFAIDTLVGVRMSSEDVFNESHALLKELLQKDIVNGVRVDHIDGLWDPDQYLQRLAGLAPSGNAPFYSVVEKILTEKEELPTSWMTHGTTGYDFAASLINLLLTKKNENQFTELYRNFANVATPPDEMAYRLKLYIMDELFPNALDNFALDLEARIKVDRRWRDWTVSELRPALSRIIACLSVYRTYRVIGQPTFASDVEVVERAVAKALHLNYSVDPQPYYFIRDLWIGRYPDEKAGPELKEWAERWVCQLQQYTGAIMAKSVEDTFFYRYVRLFAANEVGHHPAEFGRTASDFHEDNVKRQRDWPATMLGTSTHDTKMSEDVRARLLALSEIPEDWDSAIHRWSKLNYVAKKLVNNVLAPDSNEEYLLYQILLGAWPLEPDGLNDAFRARIKDYMRKALSESKAHTNWANPAEEWLEACDSFVDFVLEPQSSTLFLQEFTPFAARLAEQGMKLSLVQIALKLTVPGVPDFYQGTEVWDFSLVDPDNRRPVDFGTRRDYLTAIDKATLSELFASWKDGRIKLRLIRDLLKLRGEHPDLFARGTYTPVTLAGPQAERFVAFLREHEGRQLLVLALRRCDEGGITDLKEICQSGKIVLSQAVPQWREVLTGRQVNTTATEFNLEDLFSELPVSIFISS